MTGKERSAIKLAISVLSASPTMTLREIVQDDDLRSALGFNPWCVNEGADGDTLVGIGEHAADAIKTLKSMIGEQP